MTNELHTAPAVLATVEPTQLPATRDTASAEGLIALAIERGVGVDALERLLAMRRELRLEQARMEYYAALSRFQAALPEIVKTKPVYDRGGKLRYKYAPVEDIVAQIRAPLHDAGFSYTLDHVVTDSAVTVVLTSHHVGGHSEVASFTAPVDPDAYMSPAQRGGAATTFAFRYALRGVYGLVTADEDTDARRESERPEAAATPGGGLRPKSTAPPATGTTRPPAPATTPPQEPGSRERAIDEIENTLIQLCGIDSAESVLNELSEYVPRSEEGKPREQQNRPFIRSFQHLRNLPETSTKWIFATLSRVRKYAPEHQDEPGAEG